MRKASAAKRRNPLAKALCDPRFRPRTVKARKGRGSYRRKRQALASGERGDVTEGWTKKAPAARQRPGARSRAKNGI